MALSIPLGFSALPLNLTQLSLSAVLKCGQSFRWTTISIPSDVQPEAPSLDVEYRLVLKDRVICLRQSPDTLFYRAVFSDASSHTSIARRDAETLTWLRDYFQLDVDLVELYDKWSEVDPVFGKLRSRFAGIRMLRQDPWENLISFICSQNNHISRITNMVHSLCTRFSPALVSIPHPFSPQEDITYHPFPSPADLASPNTSAILRSLGFGYRAEYIQRTAQMLVDEHGKNNAEQFILGLRRRQTEEAREELLKFIGVGRKVADCVLLMSLDKCEVVPVDTHVHQIAVKHYGMKGTGNKTPMTPKLYNELQTKLAGIWGDYAGWAHSVLFTADLKSFSSYGLHTPSPSVSPITSPDKTVYKRKRRDSEIKPSLVPAALPLSKKRRAIVAEPDTGVVQEGSNLSICRAEGNLADRVKRRRRVAVCNYVDAVRT